MARLRRFGAIGDVHAEDAAWRHDALLVVNAGTLHRAHAPGFAIVDLDARIVRWVPLTGAPREEPLP